MTMGEFDGQSGILSPIHTRGHDLEIIGGGSLGGGIVICTVKMGFGIENRVTVVDFDICELHNLPTQWFRRGNVTLEQPKVEALGEMSAWICGREIATRCERFTGAEERPVGPIVVLAVDTLEERRRIWSNLKQRNDVSLLIDARMAEEVFEVFALDLEHDDPSEYERSLDTDEPFRAPCTRQSILYTVLGGASFVGSLLRAYTRGESFPRHLVFDFHNFMMEVE